MGLTTLNAQIDVMLNINHMIGDDDFSMGTSVVAYDGYDLNFERLQYYVSEITVVHDGGQETMIEETWLLVNANVNEVYDLGSVDATDIEGLKFSIGVDADHNHLDPASWPSDHPLAFQSPSMHWGWAPGYRFVAVEGKTGNNLLYTYEIHALGDANYHEVELAMTSENISGIHFLNVNADYLGMFTNVDVSSGLIEHSEFGSAAVLLQNMKTDVFSAGGANSVSESNEMTLDVFPNPANDVLNISINGSSDAVVSIMDLNGKVVLREMLSSSSNRLNIDHLEQGIYMLSVSVNETIIATEKVVVRR
jgi:hypothetical protein